MMNNIENNNNQDNREVVNANINSLDAVNQVVVNEENDLNGDIRSKFVGEDGSLYDSPLVELGEDINTEVKKTAEVIVEMGKNIEISDEKKGKAMDRMIDSKETQKLGEVSEIKAKKTANKNKEIDKKMRVSANIKKEIDRVLEGKTDSEKIAHLWEFYAENSSATLEFLQEVPNANFSSREKDVEKIKIMLDMLLDSFAMDSERYALDVQNKLIDANVEYVEKAKNEVFSRLWGIKSSVDTNKKSISEKDEAIAQLETEKGKIEEELKEKDIAIQNALEQESTLKGNISSLYNELQLVQSRVIELEEENNLVNEAIEKIENECANKIYHAEKTHSKTVEELKIENKGTQKRCELLIEDVKKASFEKVAELNQELSSLKEENKNITIEYKDALVSQKELDRLTAIIEEMRLENSSLKEENNNLKAQVVSVEMSNMKLEHMTSKAEGLEEDKRNLMSDKKMLQEEISELKEELKQVKNIK